MNDFGTYLIDGAKLVSLPRDLYWVVRHRSHRPGMTLV